jgi:hypothetical protein
MIQNLGKVLGIVARHEAVEIFMHNDIDTHNDVDAWGAPSEYHDDVWRGEARRWREVRRHAEAVAQRPWRYIVREAQRRGVVVNNAHPQWQTIVGGLRQSELPVLKISYCPPLR